MQQQQQIKKKKYFLLNMGPSKFRIAQTVDYVVTRQKENDVNA